MKDIKTICGIMVNGYGVEAISTTGHKSINDEDLLILIFIGNDFEGFKPFRNTTLFFKKIKNFFQL